MHKHLPVKSKLELLKRVEKGERVAKLCREAGISRTILYKWAKSVNTKGKKALISKNPKGKKHWRKKEHFRRE